MILVLINVLLALAWAAVSGSFSELNLAFGFVLGAFGLWLIREQVGRVGYTSKGRRIASLIVLFMKELALSAWSVAKLVASQRLDARPGIFAYPLTVQTDFQITLLANMITLTPGTLSIDVSDDRKFLYIHAIDCSDPDATRQGIRDGFERKILEAFS